MFLSKQQTLRWIEKINKGGRNKVKAAWVRNTKKQKIKFSIVGCF